MSSDDRFASVRRRFRPPVAFVASALILLLVAAVFAAVFTRHCARRMGGVSGDVLGATLELSTTLALIVVLA